MINVPFNCCLCKNCNSIFTSLCDDWILKWLSRPFTSFEVSRRFYNNSWRIVDSFYFAPVQENLFNFEVKQ